MARYFAQLDENKTVQQVIVADSLEWCQDRLGGEWVETFMDSPTEKYAGKEDSFDTNKREFTAKAVELQSQKLKASEIDLGGKI